jgi:hypothetical protein
MRLGLLLILAVAATNCRDRARPSESHRDPVSRDRSAPSATLVVDSGAPTAQPSIVGASGDLAKVIDAVNGSLPTAARADWQIIASAENRTERLAWLAQDFHAPVFLRAEQVDEGRLQSQTPSPLHVGVFLIRFGNCRGLAEARAKVEKSGRQNFALPVLTLFRTRLLDHNLVFVFSETPLHKSVETLFQNLDSILGPSVPCADRNAAAKDRP